jgi:predicted heme/steroid binding protein
MKPFFAMVIVAAFVVACAQQQPAKSPETKAPAAAVAKAPVAEKKADSVAAKEQTAKPADSVKVFTIEELAKCNGQNGAPAYVAVDGIVYDVTNVKAWTGGKHHGNGAGADVTDVIKKSSPHGLKVLKNLKVVGKLATVKTTEAKPAPEAKPAAETKPDAGTKPVEKKK